MEHLWIAASKVDFDFCQDCSWKVWSGQKHGLRSSEGISQENEKSLEQ